MRRTTTIGALSVAALALAGTANAQEFYTLDSSWIAQAIANDGTTAGQSLSIGGSYFLWSPDLQIVLPVGGISPGDSVGGEAGISDDGRYMCGVVQGVDGTEAARYDRVTGLWTALGGIGGTSDAETSAAWGISGDGSTVVGLAWHPVVGPGRGRAVSATPGSPMVDLGSLNEGRSTRATDASFDGSVIVGWQDGNRQGAVWDNGSEKLIFKSDGVTKAGESTAVTGDGRYVTGISFGGAEPVALGYRYDVTTNTYMEIPNLSVGANSRWGGTGITDDGKTIVGGTWGFGQPGIWGNAIIWREGVGTVTIADYLAEKGVSVPAGFVFNIAMAVSPNGEWITGVGAAQGEFAGTRSWIAHIPAPEPTCPADWNADGSLNDQDFFDWVNDFFSGAGPQGQSDFNEDGFENDQDWFDFANAFFSPGEGCN